jgi:hypothetical protein
VVLVCFFKLVVSSVLLGSVQWSQSRLHGDAFERRMRVMPTRVFFLSFPPFILILVLAQRPFLEFKNKSNRFWGK